MQDLITVEMIQEAVRHHGIFTWKFRQCSLCSSPLIYRIHEGSYCSLDTNCNCVGGFSPWIRKSFEDLADVFNNQTPEGRTVLWADFLKAGTFER